MKWVAGTGPLGQAPAGGYPATRAANGVQASAGGGSGRGEHPPAGPGGGGDDRGNPGPERSGGPPYAEGFRRTWAPRPRAKSSDRIPRSRDTVKFEIHGPSRGGDGTAQTCRPGLECRPAGDCGPQGGSSPACRKGSRAELAGLAQTLRSRMGFTARVRQTFSALLNVLPATAAVTYILSTGDPVGAVGIKVKLSGLIGPCMISTPWWPYRPPAA